jgi:hypothetical protein
MTRGQERFAESHRTVLAVTIRVSEDEPWRIQGSLIIARNLHIEFWLSAGYEDASLTDRDRSARQDFLRGGNV